MHCCSFLISTSLIVLCLLLQPQSVPSLKCSIPSLPPPLLCLLPLSLPLCFPQFLSLLYPHHAPILSIFVLLCASIFQSLPLSPHLVYTFTSSVPAPSTTLPPFSTFLTCIPSPPLLLPFFHSRRLLFSAFPHREASRTHWTGGTCEHHSQSRRMNNTSIVRSYFFKCMHTSKTCSKDVLSLSLSFTLSD